MRFTRFANRVYRVLALIMLAFIIGCYLYGLATGQPCSIRRVCM
jgi:hypothetical protein